MLLFSLIVSEAVSSDSLAPFLETHWRQDAPFNDFAPVVVESLEAEDTYLGRAPCGCVATALAQVVRAWEWPYCAGEVRTSKHSVSQGSVMDKGVDIYLRVDARAPFHWEAMGADGALDRFETARLLLWIDSLVEMMFARTGSGADIYDFRRAGSAWFEPYENVPKYDPLFVEKIVAELKRGYPVTMMIPGHQVVADGWKREAGIDYVHMNHGWGGKDDGWYPLQGDNVIIQAAQLIRPIRTVQLEAVPVECEGSVVLRWHVPRFYAKDIIGFTIIERQGGMITRTFEVGSEVRELRVSGLLAPKAYAYTVTPKMEGAVESKAVETTAVVAARPRPAIAQMPRVALPREGGSFEVEGVNLISLEALSSHISYLPDARVSVVVSGDNRWSISLSPSNMPNRQNVILTLVGSGLSGEKVIRDVAVHFGNPDPIDLARFRIVSFRLEEGEVALETAPSRAELEESGYTLEVQGVSSLESPLWEKATSAHRFFRAVATPRGE